MCLVEFVIVVDFGKTRYQVGVFAGGSVNRGL